MTNKFIKHCRIKYGDWYDVIDIDGRKYDLISFNYEWMKLYNELTQDINKKNIIDKDLDYIYLIMNTEKNQLINNDFIYNEKLHTLSSQENSIRLTAKENNIFKSMLLSTDFRIEKEFLLKNVWKYHENSESSTIDTHLYRLKAKLPDNMLELKSNSC